MSKELAGYMGDDRTRWEKPGLAFDFNKSLPESSKPITSWHPHLQYRRDKNIDGTSHHYLSV